MKKTIENYNFIIILFNNLYYLYKINIKNLFLIFYNIFNK